MHAVRLYNLSLVVLFALCAVQALSQSALAQDSTSEREREAKAAFEAGVTAAKAEDYVRAREHFMRSRQLVVKASTLLNLAIADFKLGLVDEAMFALDAIEAPAEGPDQERLRKRARKVRGEIEALRESIDAQKALPKGQQSAEEARQDGSELRAAVVTEMTHESAPAPTLMLDSGEGPRAAQPAHVGSTPSLAVHDDRSSLAVPRALLALGGALGAAAIGTTFWWRDRNQDHDACLHSHEVQCEERSEIARQRTAALSLTLSLGISAAALITSGAILLVGRKDRRSHAVSVSAWGARAELGLSALGRF